MITQQTQIKVNLPSLLKDYLASKAGKFGMPLAGYIKYLILKDVSQNDYPTFLASPKTEKAYTKAQKEEGEEKLQKIENLDTFFESI